MRRPTKFTEAELRRTLRAVKKEGVRARVEIENTGRISIIPLSETETDAVNGQTTPNEWDTVQ
jgi:hypothetical protein